MSVVLQVRQLLELDDVLNCHGARICLRLESDFSRATFALQTMAIRFWLSPTMRLCEFLSRLKATKMPNIGLFQEKIW